MITRWVRALLLLCAVAAVPARAEWREARSAHFQVYSQDSERDLRAYTGKLERFDALLRMLTGVKEEPDALPLRVYLVNSGEAAQAMMATPGASVLGFYTATAYGPLAVAGRETTPAIPYYTMGPDVRLSADNVLFHEYAHHFMLHYFPAAYPHWYVEGFAEYMGATDIADDGSIDFGLPAGYRTVGLGDHWVPIAHLVQADDLANRLDAVYSEGWLLVHYLRSTPELTHQLAGYLRAINAGKTPAEAAKVFGDLHALDGALQGYAHRSGLGALRVKGVGQNAGEITVRPLSPAEAALIGYDVRFRQYLSSKDSVRLADQIARTAARFPVNGYALALLGIAQADAGQLDAADATADRLLAIEPNNPRGLLIKGKVADHRLRNAKSTDLAAWKAARAWMVKANHIAPDDPVVLRDYYLSYTYDGAPVPPPAAQAGLLHAFDLVPQDPYLRTLVANDFENRQMYADAITAIEPLAYAAHGGGGDYRAMLDRLKAAQSGKAGPAPAPAAGTAATGAAH